MHAATLLRLALTKEFGSAHYIKIGDGRLCMQLPHSIVGVGPLYLIWTAGCGCFGPTHSQLQFQQWFYLTHIHRIRKSYCMLPRFNNLKIAKTR